MTRDRARSILAVCVAVGFGGVAVEACGSSTNGTGASGGTGTKDAGHKDSSVFTGDDDSSVGGDDAAFEASTGDDASDDSGDGTAGDDAGDSASDDGGTDAGPDGDDGGSDAGPGGDDAGPDAGSAPDAGHVDAGTDGGPATTPDAGRDAGSSGDGSTCDFSGTWATAISVDVTWAAGGSFDIVIAPGSGTVKQWLLGTRTVSGGTTTDTTKVCGIQLPDFTGTMAAGSETWGVRFPDALFDDGDVAPFTIPGTVSGTSPTAAYATSNVAVLLGLTLADATSAAWPATISTDVDTDKDGKPGITASVAQGLTYSDVPLDFSVVFNPGGVTRSNRLYLAIRQVTSFSAHFSTCDHATGTATVPQLGSGSNKKYAIDSHVIGCGLTGSATDCTSAQTTFVDENQPVFVPSSSSFVSSRVPGGTTCATVRGMF
jgi:hypothetical protein